MTEPLRYFGTELSGQRNQRATAFARRMMTDPYRISPEECAARGWALICIEVPLCDDDIDSIVSASSALGHSHLVAVATLPGFERKPLLIPLCREEIRKFLHAEHLVDWLLFPESQDFCLAATEDDYHDVCGPIGILQRCVGDLYRRMDAFDESVDEYITEVLGAQKQWLRERGAENRRVCGLARAAGA